MAGLLGQPDLAPLIRTYREYFSKPETDPFGDDYAAVLDLYQVDPLNAAAAPTPASVTQQIYAASQQVEPTAFLLWHATPRLVADQDPGCMGSARQTNCVRRKSSSSRRARD